jgi:hypothetical protein
MPVDTSAKALQSSAAANGKQIFDDVTIEQFAQAQVQGALSKILFSLNKRPEFEGPDADEESYLKAVVENLQEYSSAVSAGIESLISDRQDLASKVRNIAGLRLSEPVPVGSSILRFGDLDTAVRTPGEPNGMIAGRTPRLIWTEVPLSSSELPSALQSVVATLETGSIQGLEYAQLPFCRGGVLWHLWFPAVQAGADADAFIIALDGPAGQELHKLDWTNEPFYRLNEMRRFRFSSYPEVYIRCFFHLVRGQLGRFNILEDEADLDGPIAWRKDMDNREGEVAKAKAKIREFLMPLTRTTFKASGEAVFRCCVLFKNAVFHTDVVLSPTGTLELTNEALKLEELPVHASDGLGRPQGDEPGPAPTEAGVDEGGQP